MAAARQQLQAIISTTAAAIIRMRTSSRTAAVHPYRSKAQSWQRALLRHTHYSLAVLR